jgi:nucleoid-associated protein YgaU
MSKIQLQHFILILSCLGLFGCSTVSVEKSSLQLQEFQAKIFEVDKRTAFNSTISVFQDVGYVISSASFESGFITGDSSDKPTVTASFEYYDNKTKIRLNFVDRNKNLFNLGTKANDAVLDSDIKIYNSLFDKIGETIFIRAGNDQIRKASINEYIPSERITHIDEKIIKFEQSTLEITDQIKKISISDVKSTEKVAAIEEKLVKIDRQTTEITEQVKNINLQSKETNITLSKLNEVQNYSKTNPNENYTSSYTSSSTSGNYTTVNGDTLEKIIQKTIKDSPLKVELIKEAFILKNPLIFSILKGNKLKTGTIVKIPENAYLSINDEIKKSIPEESIADKNFQKWREDSRKWVRFP